MLIVVYSDLQCAVVWNNTVGNRFDVKCGDVLSPYLFYAYVDDLIKELGQSGHEIYIGRVSIGCILFYMRTISCLVAVLVYGRW